MSKGGTKIFGVKTYLKNLHKSEDIHYSMLYEKKAHTITANLSVQ